MQVLGRFYNGTQISTHVGDEMLNVYRVLAFFACAAAAWWVYSQPVEIERWVALLGSIAALAGSFLPSVVRRAQGSMTQEVGAYGIAVQSGRDAHVAISRESDSRDV